MSQYDLLVRNGTVVTTSGESRTDLAVADGRIVAITPDLSGTSKEEINAEGLRVFPGVVDAHVHFNEPGRTNWEGFATGTAALAAGGTTTYIEMPLNSSPPTVDAESFDLKLQAAQAQSLVDFALWGGLVPGNLAHLDELAERGVVGFKAFMSNSGIEDFPMSDVLTLYEGMARVAKLGKIVIVHAENDQITSYLARRAIEQGRTGIRDYLTSRPMIAELEAIERAILFASETGCPLHIVHVSSGRGVSLVVEAWARGVNVSCETCPHYLVLTEENECTWDLVARGEQHSMSTLRITAGPFKFIARMEEADAPKTCEAFSRILPFHSKIIQARWSGESAWIPLGDFQLGVGYENHTSYPSPGQILFYPGGFSETEILFPYGGTRFASKLGQLAGNHFLTIVSGSEQLRELGRLVLWEGAQDIVFEKMESDEV